MRRVAASALCAALLFVAPASDADLDEDLERLRQAIEERRERVTRYEREERGLLAALEAVERTAELLEREVVRTRQRASETREVLAQAQREAVGLERRLARTENSMALRAVTLYKTGEFGATPVLFSSSGLREFLSRVTALRMLLVNDVELLARHRAESRALEVSYERAAQAAADSNAAELAAAERVEQLRDEHTRKRVIVGVLRSSRARERAALAEFETAARALEETVAALPTDAVATGSLGPPFETLRGRLAPPVAGSLAADFGRVVDDEFRTETFRKGVEFEAPIGMPVSAVASGHVRFAGRFRGYGNLIILDHGDQYFTVSAHLSRVDVEVGQSVAIGDRIGLVGESGSLVGPLLYFEVRRGGTPLDPREWLAPVGTSARRR